MKKRQSSAHKLKSLLESPSRLFDVRSLSVLWGITKASAKVEACRWIKTGMLVSVRRGLYSVATQEPSPFELANALYQPSVISMESALNYWGVLASTPQVVTSVANRSRRCVAGNQEFVYRRVPRKILELGAVKEDGAFIMTPQKALLDFLYFGAKGLAVVVPGDIFLTKNIDWKKTGAFLIFYPAVYRNRIQRLLEQILKRKTRDIP